MKMCCYSSLFMSKHELEDLFSIILSNHTESMLTLSLILVLFSTPRREQKLSRITLLMKYSHLLHLFIHVSNKTFWLVKSFRPMYSYEWRSYSMTHLLKKFITSNIEGRNVFSFVLSLNKKKIIKAWFHTRLFLLKLLFQN